MTELSAPQPPSVAPRLLQLLALTVGAALIAAAVTLLRGPVVRYVLPGTASGPPASTRRGPHEPAELPPLPRDAAGAAARRAAHARPATKALAAQAALD